MFPDYGEYEMSRMMAMGPWGPMAFMGGETVTIALERYEELKDKPKRLEEEKKKAVAAALESGKLAMFCDVVQKDLQYAIDSKQVDYQFLKGLYSVQVCPDKHYMDQFQVSVLDPSKLVNQQQVLQICYTVRDGVVNKYNSGQKQNWTLGALGMVHVVNDAVLQFDEILKTKAAKLAPTLQGEIRKRKQK
jgi:hypothetical protein